MKENSKRRIRPVNVAEVRATFGYRDNGVVVVRSTDTLREYPARVTDRLELWAEQAPNRIFLAQRAADDSWQTITYSETLHRVRKLASGLLKNGLSPTRPLIILSGNSIEHALLALAAMYAGIPYAPIAPSYSLAVKEFVALRHVWQNLEPGMAFVQNGTQFTPALKAVMRDKIVVAHHGSTPAGIDTIPLTELEAAAASPDAEEAHQNVGPDSIAKILYTSGSTGLPKGVITTHRMLCSNQLMLEQVMPCLAEQPPVLCDWLPWNHTFGGSHNFGIALHNGGTLYIDAGKPTPELFGDTIRNLREIAPTAYFNVPKGYELLVERLRADAALRKIFFSRLNLLFFAAAGLSQKVWDEVQDIAFETCGEEILVVTGLGATETAPFALSTGLEGSSSGWIGLPVPGVEMKLVPIGDRTEARVRGPSITPGFWRRTDLDASAFDEENFYRMGDAIKLADPANPQTGFVFDGRLNEDFKLSSGTWVRVGALRARLIAHFGGLLQDVVLAGPDRDYVGALLFPALSACRKCCAGLPDSAAAAEVLARSEVRSAFQEKLNSFAAMNTTNSTRVVRAALLDTPPSMEARELTDKGSINQGAVLKNRVGLVEELYRESPTPGVLAV
jgi:feruloyl-CoA synthase